MPDTIVGRCIVYNYYFAVNAFEGIGNGVKALFEKALNIIAYNDYGQGHTLKLGKGKGRRIRFKALILTVLQKRLGKNAFI